MNEIANKPNKTIIKDVQTLIDGARSKAIRAIDTQRVLLYLEYWKKDTR